MASDLGENATKWIEIILSFHGDPSKYGFPKKIFDLPDLADDSPKTFVKYAADKWEKIKPKKMNPYNKIDERIPFWMVFTLPRRYGTLFLAVWDDVWERRDRELYQEIHYNFQELIQNFVREELRLFKTVRPFRLKTGSSVLAVESKLDDEIDQSAENQIRKFTSPQKILHNVAHFVRNKTIHAGIAYTLLIERFSALIAKTKTTNQIEKVTSNFIKQVNRLREKYTIPDIETVEQIEAPTSAEVNKTKENIEFDTIKLQEYDGYVEIQARGEEETRNFRIYDCIEEDRLREEMWKNRRYPLRRLVDEILDERYSRPRKKYTLGYGVDIEVIEPNWMS